MYIFLHDVGELKLNLILISKIQLVSKITIYVQCTDMMTKLIGLFFHLLKIVPIQILSSKIQCRIY